jgi:negative regulator of flagellin synthesis FlgM
MKITETNVNFGRQAYVQGAENAQSPENAQKNANVAEPKKAPEDKVSLSASARDLQVAQDAMSMAPDVRTDKVQDVRSAIDSGNYKVDAQQVADKIIGFSIDQMV